VIGSWTICPAAPVILTQAESLLCKPTWQTENLSQFHNRETEPTEVWGFFCFFFFLLQLMGRKASCILSACSGSGKTLISTSCFKIPPFSGQLHHPMLEVALKTPETS
jgi:hypothetical protein